MMMEQMPKVSVCVVTYNPQKEKLMKTLESIARQKYANLQIILSDDGSEESFFNEAREFFEKANITDYKMVEAPENQGTVKNVKQALLAADGVFIKTISPGDCLTDDTILSDWIKHLMDSGRQWSFSNAIYYSRKSGGVPTVHRQPANPQLVDCYTRHDDDTCRWNLALGAAIVCERELMIRYIEQIVGIVKYAEDNIFRLMMFHGILPDYFPEEAVLYECDSGISTCGDSVWSKRVWADWTATDELMLAQTAFGDELQKKMQAALRRKKGWSAQKKKWLQYTDKGRIYKRFRYYWHRRLTGGSEGERLCK